MCCDNACKICNDDNDENENDDDDVDDDDITTIITTALTTTTTNTNINTNTITITTTNTTTREDILHKHKIYMPIEQLELMINQGIITNEDIMNMTDDEMKLCNMNSRNIYKLKQVHTVNKPCN